MDSYKQYFYNSESFFLLRTTGWIVGVMVGTIIGIVYNPFAGVFPAVLTSILVDIYLFKIKGLKETSYKSPAAFQKLCKASPEAYDRYASAITWAKPIVLMPLAAFAICNYFDNLGYDPFDNIVRQFNFLDMNLTLMASTLLYIPFMGIFLRQKIALWHDLITIEEFNANRSPTPRYYGVPGYNSQGVYTGSPTSTGGCSG